MFTGIIESLGLVKSIIEEGSNKIFTIESDITDELRIDQSVAHDGVCLTVVAIDGAEYEVAAVAETLEKSNFHSLQIGDIVNLERSVTMERRLDGHMVQGHVDTVATCIDIQENEGSWLFRFQVDESYDQLMVEKGSICINGTSLTIFDIEDGKFSVAIIPYTYENTSIKNLSVGSLVNIEFDILGKYIVKYMAKINS